MEFVELELIIFHEEQIFRKSLAFASGIKYPELPQNDEDPKALEKYEKQKVKYEQKLQQAIDTAVQTREIPDGVLGLAPDGDRTVLWRWMVLFMRIQLKINLINPSLLETFKNWGLIV